MKNLNKYYLSEATSCIDLKGENKIKAKASLLLDKYVAGPEPIDLPKRIIFFGSNFKVLTAKSKILKESSRIRFSEIYTSL